ncbi:uncharacterized protein [Dysidea avara]|uniref:uncharacterized protein n=1 Tax=Dysidea avara TaxID=196820 RepID=UPI00331D6B44
MNMCCLKMTNTLLTGILVLVYTFSTAEAFTKPLVNLRCENGSAMSDHLVNVTWQPTKDQSPDDIVFRLQNCQTSISCSNGYRRNSGCPYFASTGLNGGWEFLVPVSETSCSVTVTIVDFYDPFSRPLSATESCTFSVPAPNISAAVLDDQIVGNPLSLQCNTTTVSGIHSKVQIEWMINDAKIVNDDDRRTVTNTIYDNGCTSTLHFSYLTEDDNGLYTCVVKIPGTNPETVSQSIELRDFNIPRLTVHVTAKDRSVNVLECNATTVRGVTSSATFVWKSNDNEIDRVDVSGTPVDNSMVFTHIHDTLGEVLNSTNTSTVYKCYVEINTKSKVNATGEIAIDMTSTGSPITSSTNSQPTDSTTMDNNTSTNDSTITSSSSVTSPFCTTPDDKKPLPGKFDGPPIVNLTCTPQYVNVTWIPMECYRPTEVINRLQNCHASIKFGNGKWKRSGCPYFSPTGLNGGWQWELEQPVAETSCTVEVTFVDFYDPFSSPLTQTVYCEIPRKTADMKRSVLIKNMLVNY